MGVIAVHFRNPKNKYSDLGICFGIAFAPMTVMSGCHIRDEIKEEIVSPLQTLGAQKGRVPYTVIHLFTLFGIL